MAGILAQNPELLAAIEPDAGALPDILSVVSLYGVMDRLTCLKPNIPVGSTMIEAYGGPEALKPEVDAAHAITPMDLKFTKHPPCFLTCGEWDPLTASDEIYAKRLTREGYAVKSKTYAKATHGFFSFPEGDAKSTCRRDMVAFLKDVEQAS
jgi:acetyl esterase/lipase